MFREDLCFVHSAVPGTYRHIWHFYVSVTNDQTFSLLAVILKIMILAHGLQWSQFSQDLLAYVVQAEV